MPVASDAAIIIQCDPTDDHEDAAHVPDAHSVVKVQDADEDHERALQRVCDAHRDGGHEGHCAVRRHGLSVEEHSSNEHVKRHLPANKLCLCRDR